MRQRTCSLGVKEFEKRKNTRLCAERVISKFRCSEEQFQVIKRSKVLL